MNFRSFLFILPLLAFLSGCTAQAVNPPFSEWAYSDLRKIDDFHEISQNSDTPDIVALYTRQDSRDIQIRLDFFDHPQVADYDLYLAFDAIAGGNSALPIDAVPSFAWETLLILPASGEIQVLGSQMQSKPAARVQVFRDAFLDTLTLGFSRSTLPTSLQNWRVQAWITSPGGKTVVDSLPVTRSGSLPPEPAQVLMAFSQAYPAYTPALALRRWDGAHTGPSGGRHGLANLLRTAASQKVPLVLLDMYNPFSLSALDYLGGIEQIQLLQNQGLLILPRYAPAPLDQEVGPEGGWSDLLSEISAEATAGFNFSVDAMEFIPSGVLPHRTSSRVIFLAAHPQPEITHPVQTTTPVRWQNSTILQIPRGETPQQASAQGPTEEFRKALVAAAVDAQTREHTELLILGGELPASSWGDPQAARATLRYLRTHPWVRFLGEPELLSLHGLSARQEMGELNITSDALNTDTTLTAPQPAANAQIPQHTLLPVELLSALQQAPDNPLGEAARQAALALSAPVYPQAADLNLLRAKAQGNIWSLLYASYWAENPQPTQSCEQDIDRDGALECVVSTNDILAVFELPSGEMSYLFALLKDKQKGAPAIHQIIGPSSQLISGLSQPETWDLSRGAAADPAVITGAFTNPELDLLPSFGAQSIHFSSLDGIKIKYQLNSNGVYIFFHIPPESQTITFSIPILLDPWLRFQSGWADHYNSQRDGLVWRGILSNALQVQIASSCLPSTASFLESKQWMSAVENPNREQTAGHFLPFPMTVLSCRAQGDILVEIEISADN